MQKVIISVKLKSTDLNCLRVLRIVTASIGNVDKTKCDQEQFRPFVHYGTIITRSKLLIKIP